MGDWIVTAQQHMTRRSVPFKVKMLNAGIIQYNIIKKTTNHKQW